MRSLADSADLDALLDAPVAIVYKHSTRCPISAMAHEQIAQLAGERPDVPVALVDVHDDRALSLEIARRLGIVHHSPQAILLVRGRVVWHGSHFDVRAEELLQRVEMASAA